MYRRDVYLGQESLEDVLSYIEGSLKRGSSIFSIASSMIGTQKAKLIVTKEYAMIDTLNNDEVIGLLTEYINDNFKQQIQKICVTDTINTMIEKHFSKIGMDEYSDFLTDKLHEEPYQKVHHYIRDISVSYEPYMKEHYPLEFENMTLSEHERALVKFIKENLCSCKDAQSVTQQDEN